MALSPSASMRRSPASSAHSLKPSSSSHHEASSSRHSEDDHSDNDVSSSSPIPLDTLVNHLLASKRSLSSMNHLLHATHLSTSARQLHEDTLITLSRVTFLRSSILDEAAILVKLRRSLQGTYDWGKRDFKRLVEKMDEHDEELGRTMGMLRKTVVMKGLRPEGEEGERNLLDFVDEDGVHGMREAMKKSIELLQGYQQSFDGDLLRFDTDIRTLKKSIIDSALPTASTILPPGDQEEPVDEDEDLEQTADRLLETITDHAANMALLLASLTKHFDMCVTAIRTTEGAADLARRKVATGGHSTDNVSISGVIAEQQHNPQHEDLTPQTAQDRAEMLRVVMQDAQEVEDVVQEISSLHSAIEYTHAQLSHLRTLVRGSLSNTLISHGHLQSITPRLPSYLHSSTDFLTRWTLETSTIANLLTNMSSTRDFYEGYASAYSSLLLEFERRRVVEGKIAGVWRKAAEAVGRIVEGDERAREGFREDVGEYLPEDLWEGLREGGRVRRWEVVPLREEDGGTGEVVRVRGEKGKGKAQS